MSTSLQSHNPSTIEQLFSILQNEYKIDTTHFGAQTTLLDTGLDSLSIADLLFEIEDVFAIKLDEMSSEQMPKQLSELVRLIDVQMSKKH